MDFSKFFIDRPIFAAVLSIVIFAAGLIAIPLLPISEYPEVVPPSVVVRTVYPGANPKVIAETVATPLEEAINGVEDMMYIKSVAGSDGVLQMTVTFRPGTDADDAAVRVQNRVSQALARLPEDVRRQGVTTQKQSPTFLMVVHLTSPDGKYDTLYLRNYARLHVKDAARAPARRRRRADLRRRRLRDARLARPGQDRLARPDRRRRGARDARAERAGLGRPARRRADAQRQRLPHPDQRPGPPAHRGGVRRHRAQERRRRRDRAPVRRRPHRTRRRRLHAALAARRQERRRHRHLPGARAPTRSRSATRCIAKHGRAVQALPGRRRVRGGLRHHHLRARLDQGGGDHAAGSDRCWSCWW